MATERQPTREQARPTCAGDFMVRTLVARVPIFRDC